MKTTLKLTAALLTSTIALTACLHDDDAASGPAVPANAVTITDANANSIMASSTLTMGTVLAAAESTGGPADIMQLIIDRAKDAIKNPPATGQDPVIGTDLNQVIPCTSGGNITVTGHSSGTTSGSGSETDTFNNCQEFGLTINGSITIGFSWNGNNWNAYASGSLTINDGVEDITISGISVVLNGNDSTGALNITSFQFTFDPASGGGFAVQLTTALEMNELLFCPDTPTAGVITVSGAGGTQVRLTVTSTNVMTLELNDGSGTWTAVTGSPFTCASFFG